MIHGKTAGLIALATSLSPLVSGKDNSIYQSLSEYGESLGMAFQIQDDILGIWGDTALTGKSSSSDILTHKKSLPIIYGLTRSPAFQSLWLKEHPTSEDVIEMANLLESCGAKDYAQSQAESYTQKSFNHLEKLFPKKNGFSLGLFQLTEKLLIRRY